MATPAPPPPGLEHANGVLSVEEQQSVIGINFGNAYASIAVINKEGRADSIANEDGERQIACAIAFNGSETYIGNQALPQLVKNSQNTILGFRDCLGKSFAEITEQPTLSAPIQDIDGVPSYAVTVIPSLPPSLASTPAPTPPPEPQPLTKHYSVREITALFLRSLLQSAQDFLSSRLIKGAIMTCPAWFTEKQKAALLDAAKDAGINVLQLLDESAAAVVAYAPSSASPVPIPDAKGPQTNGVAAAAPSARTDRKTLVLDIGSSSTTTTLLSVSAHSLMHVLHRSHTTTLGGQQLDTVLISHFSKEFTKKTKVPLSLTSTDAQDLRAIAKLRQACEITKRSLSATSGSATCDVESLKDGMDFHGSINAMRFDLLARGVYTQVVDQVKACLSEAGFDPVQVDEVILVGGSATLPSIAEAVSTLLPPPTTLTSSLVPSQTLAIGCALQARELLLRPLPTPLPSELLNVKATTQPIGLVFPGLAVPTGEQHPPFFEVIRRETPLPVRRRAKFVVPAGTEKVGVEVWEGKEEVKVEMLSLPKLETPEGEEIEDEDEDDEDEEPEEVRTLQLTPSSHLLSLLIPIVPSAAAVEEPSSKKSKKKTPKGPVVVEAEVEIVVGEDGTVRARGWQVGHKGASVEKVIAGW